MPPNQNPKKILLVEDETFIADLYAYELQKSGFSVKVANDGVTGLRVLESETFDLLLLDIMLPGMNGLELLKEWKSKNQASNMIVLLLTNLGQDSVIKEGFTLGAQGYLIKASYTPEQIVTEIKNAFAGKPAPGAPPSPTQGTPPGTPPTQGTPPTSGTPPTPTSPPQA